MMKFLPVLALFLIPLLCWPQSPELGIPLGHKRAIHSLSFSADGTLLLSGSADGTLKLWDVASGKLLKSSQESNQAVLGSELSPDGRYAIYSWSYTEGRAKLWDIQADQHVDLTSAGLSSLSADAKWGLDYEGNLVKFPGLKKQAMGGDFTAKGFTPDGKSLFQISPGQLTLYDIATQEQQKLIPMEGLTGDAYFAAHGKLLIAYLYNFDTGEELTKRWLYPSGRLLPELPEYHTIQDVSPDGRNLLLTEEGGNCKLFSLERNAVIQEYKVPASHTAGSGMGMMTGGPSGLSGGAISPDGRLISWGQGDGVVLMHDLQSGRLLYTLEAHSQSVNYLFPSSNNKSLICTTDDNALHFWDFTQGSMSRSAAFEDVTAETIAATEQQAFFTVLADQQQAANRMKYHEGVIPLKDNIYLLGVADDGSLGASFEMKMKDGPLQTNGWPSQIRTLDLSIWDMNTKEAKQTWVDLPADDFSPGIAVFSPDNKYLLLGENDYFTERDVASRLFDLEKGDWAQRFPESPGDVTSSLAFSPDGIQVLSGTYEGLVNLFDAASGRLIHTFEGHKGAVNMVCFSPDGQKIFSASNDATSKIWDVKEQKEIITLMHIDQEDWIVLSPNGQFDASQNAMNLLYYLVENNGKQEIVELEQLKTRYYEPGLLQKVMGFSDERARSVVGMDEIALYPEVEATIDNDLLAIQLKERSGGIGPVSIFVNGKEVVGDINPQRKTSLSYDLKQCQNYLFRNPDSTNLVSLRVYNQAAWLKSSAINLVYQPSTWSKGSSNGGTSAEWVGKLNPKMYVVSIGTSNYTGSQLDLIYADQDATMMAKALQSVGGALFTNGDSLEVHCFSTASVDSTGLENTPVHWQFANKENIKATFDAIKGEAKAEDIIVVYLSGHGVAMGESDNKLFYYLTQGVASEDDLADPATRSAHTISSEEFTTWINDIPALKQVFIIDACNSGQIVENLTSASKTLNSSQIRAIDRMKDRTGMFVLSGSASDKVSYEAGEYGQGLLTYSLLQGMVVASQKTAEGKFIDVMRLFQYARDEVPRLASSINGIQTPMLGFPTKGASFDIGIVNDDTDIPIGTKKPVFVRSTFINQSPRVMRDDLGLIQLVEDGFREETEKGKNADLIYVNVTDYPGAYYLSGLYTVNQEDGTIQLTANLINGDNSIPLDIPETDSTKNLVRYLMRAVKKAVRDQ